MANRADTALWIELRTKTGWWFGTMEFYDFPYIGNSNPNWRTHIFQRDWNHHYNIVIGTMIIVPSNQLLQKSAMIIDE